MASHPYYPTDIELPGFVPPLLRFDYILGVFFSAFIALFLTTWLVSGVH
jgi:cholestenol delta-isomerase